MNAYVPGLQSSGQVAGFLSHRGFPIPSPAALGKVGHAFRVAMARYARANDIPWIRFGKSDRKIEVIRRYLEAAERDGRPRVVAIGVAQEFQWAWDATQKDATGGGAPWFSYLPRRPAGDLSREPNTGQAEIWEGAGSMPPYRG